MPKFVLVSRSNMLVSPVYRDCISLLGYNGFMWLGKTDLMSISGLNLRLLPPKVAGEILLISSLKSLPRAEEVRNPNLKLAKL